MSQCRGVIVEYNRLLAKMNLPEEVIMGVIFEIHPTYDNVRGRSWFHGVYVRLDERAKGVIEKWAVNLVDGLPHD